MNIQTIIAVVSGGALGALGRLLVLEATNRYLPDATFPLGTLYVNLLGSFFVGVLFALFNHTNLSPYIKLFIATGFLGAFTTFSTFAIESVMLLESSKFFYALGNILFNVIGSILAAAISYFATAKILQAFA
jgi:CrcB protein